MHDLKAVSSLVKQILEENTSARNSDNVLYLEILRYYSSAKGVDLYQLTVPDFLMKLEQKGFPRLKRSDAADRKCRQLILSWQRQALWVHFGQEMKRCIGSLPKVRCSSGVSHLLDERIERWW